MSNNNNIVNVLLPTGAKIPMRQHTAKSGNQGFALLDVKKDGGRWLNRTGVVIEAIGDRVPVKVTVAGVDVEVHQRIGIQVPSGKVDDKGQPIMRFEENPAGSGEVNSKGFPVYRGSAVLPVNGADHRFDLRIADRGDTWNVSATAWPKSERAAKVKSLAAL